MNTALLVLLLIPCLAVYMAPTAVAWSRQHPSMVPIFIVNLFLGWALVGWVAALAWAFSGKNTARRRSGGSRSNLVSSTRLSRRVGYRRAAARAAGND